MRKLIIIILILSLVLTGCFASDPDSCKYSPSGPDQVTHTPTSSGQTDPDDMPDDTRPNGDLQNSDVNSTNPSDPVGTEPTGNSSGGPTGPTVPEDTGATKPSRPQSSEDPTDPTDPTEKPTEPTRPKEDPTVPTDPTDPPHSTQPTVPTQPEETDPPATEPQIDKDSYEFKRQVAQYAAQYLNQYRVAAGVPACTILPGMTLVAEYRADQLTYNYSHNTADKREALAYYEYGKWVDATLAGLDASKSYYDAEASEAICAGFEGKTAEEMGKRIADMIRNSSSHWSYVGSSNFSYIGIGVEYRAGTAYGWYGCIMVGRTNYG